jgi:hypothetical protein
VANLDLNIVFVYLFYTTCPLIPPGEEFDLFEKEKKGKEHLVLEFL